MLIGLPVAAGQTLQIVASVILIIVFVNIVRRQPTLFTATMGIRAVAWAVGSILWLAGRPIPTVVPWWIAFLVLTIVGERLELSRLLSRAAGKEAAFLSAAGIYFLGVVIGSTWPSLGWAVAGLGMIAMTVWLMAYDLATRTIRGRGLTRYVAACLLSGYFWLAAAGVLILSQLFLSNGLRGPGGSWFMDAPTTRLIYDAVLHAVLIGFVFSMIFGHAPIIFPAVLTVRMDYRPRFYVHLVLLELSVALRVVSDLAGRQEVRQWAGLLNAAAILLFLGQTISTIHRRRSAPPITRSPKERRTPGPTVNLDRPCSE